jgi:hypothetical protein
MHHEIDTALRRPPLGKNPQLERVHGAATDQDVGSRARGARAERTPRRTKIPERSDGKIKADAEFG